MTEMERLLKVYEHPEAAEKGILEILVEQCLDYIQKKVDVKILQTKRQRMDARTFKVSFKEAEAAMNVSHDVLATGIAFVNRLCDKVGVEKVCPGTSYDDFAMRLIEQIYAGN